MEEWTRVAALGSHSAASMPLPTDMSLLSHSVSGALRRSGSQQTSSQEPAPAAAALEVVSLVKSIEAAGKPLKNSAATDPIPKPKLSCTSPKTSAFAQQYHSSAVVPVRNSREGSSPLDMVPVKEGSGGAKSPSTLRISENSAFRPVQPAPTRAFGPVFQSATVGQLFRQSRVEAQEPIYVKASEVTSHPAKDPPPIRDYQKVVL